MLKRVCLVLLGVLVLFGSSCPPEQVGGSDPGNPDNKLVPRTWSQVHSDKENSGFNAVNTHPVVPALRKWTAPIGPVAFSSPVIGPDGTIYFGNTSGELVALNPDGSQKWRRKLAASILSSPAVNAERNQIYVLAQEPAGANSFVARLYWLESGGGLFNISSETIFTSAAPKLWGDFVFVTSQTGGLYVFTQQGLGLVARFQGEPCFNLVCGSGPDLFGWLGDIVDFFGCIVNASDCLGEVFLGQAPGPIVEPSVAIADAATLVGDRTRPVVVLASPRCVTALRFFPAGDGRGVFPDNDGHFELLWSHAMVPVDCDFETTRTTTPAAILDGQVVVADYRGLDPNRSSTVKSLDLMSGALLWRTQLNAIQFPPVTALRHIYVVTNFYLAVIDSNGVVVRSVPLQGIGQAAALSLNYLYVTTDKGLQTFFDLPFPQPGIYYFDPINAGGNTNGRSFPAIARDGTIYISCLDGFMRAYNLEQAAPVALQFPAIVWQSPANGATVSYTPGQSLMVSVAGADGTGADGTVRFVSDLDGVLCADVPAGPASTCITPAALSFGTHRLSATTSDAQGAGATVDITVTVANTPPTLAILEPANSAAFPVGTSITLVASVTDPDDPAFPTSRLHWTSSLDGDLGDGPTVTRQLSVGTHVITVTAADEQGAPGQASISLEVTNTAPTVTINEPTGETILFSGSPIPFSATVTDAEEPTIPAERIRWSSSLDGELGTGSSISKPLSIGTHVITLIATDAQGLTGQDTVSVTVQSIIQ